MGCWNGTCAITHLPLISGEKVRAYILVPTHLFSSYKSETDPLANGGHPYSTALMHPLTYGIKGKYNDYGCVEEIQEDPNNSLILEFFNDLLKTERVKMFDDSDKPVRSFDDIEELLTSIERGSTPFSFCMIMESALMATVKALDENPEEYGRRINVDAALKELNLIKDFRKSTNDAASILLRSQFGKLPGQPWNRMGEFIFGDSGQNPMFDNMFSMEYMWPLIESDVSSVNLQLAEHALLCCAFQSLRRTWMPQSGAGSQDDSYPLHRKLAQHVVEHIAAKRQEAIAETNVEEYPEELEYINKRF